MFRKMKNRKGFTLIEMMVVIAIIAILVAVIIPVVTGSTDKAAAATNASNLRGVEGEVITMMLLEPDLFGDQKGQQAIIDQTREDLTNEGNRLAQEQERLGELEQDLADANDELEIAKAELKEAQDEIAAITLHDNCGWLSGCSQGKSWLECKAIKGGKEVAERALSGAQSTVNTAQAAVNNLTTQVNNQQEVVTGLQEANKNNQAANNKAEYDLYRFVAVDGQLKLSDDIILEAPVSKAVSTDTLTIAKDQPMVVYVDNTNYEAYAYYLSGEEELSAKDFAIAAGNEDLAG